MRLFNILLILLCIAVSVTKLPFDEARADDTITIGEINTYSQLTSFTVPYRNGWQLALQEINDAGGIRGKKLRVISRHLHAFVRRYILVTDMQIR